MTRVGVRPRNQVGSVRGARKREACGRASSLPPVPADRLGGL